MTIFSLAPSVPSGKVRWAVTSAVRMNIWMSFGAGAGEEEGERRQGKRHRGKEK
jgi:hypothetical protein